MSKTKEEQKPELIFKVTTKVKATNKTPEMIYLSATNNLLLWKDIKEDLKESRCQDERLNGLTLAEHGFWASKDELDLLLKEKKIKVE